MNIVNLGLVPYEPTYEAMQEYSRKRGQLLKQGLHDQLWICEHFPVYTQGLAGKIEHILNPGEIPVIQTNRGGQVTYHGPGQVVAYPLLDLKTAGYFVKEYVFKLEEAVIRTLGHLGVTGHRVRGAPGIYVRLDDPFSHAAVKIPNHENRNLTPISSINFASLGVGKIAALGIKVSRHFTYHGVALNVAMDLEPFSRINPCGYAGLQTVDLSTIGVSVSASEVADIFAGKLVTYLAP